MATQQRLEKENTIRHRKRQSVASACFVVALLLFAFSIGLHRAAFQAYLRTKGKSHDCAEALMEIFKGAPALLNKLSGVPQFADRDC